MTPTRIVGAWVEAVNQQAAELPVEGLASIRATFERELG
jgi:hypothetical protein